MLLDGNEQELSIHSFQCTPFDACSEFIRRDEFSEIIATMTKTLHVNTPEQTMNGIDSDDESGNREQQLLEQLQTQLIRNQMQRTQARNYTRILQQSNTPARWYKAPLTNCSIYFYDPNYQKHVQQQANLSPKIKSNIHSIPLQSRRCQDCSIPHSKDSFSFTPRTKYMLDLCNTTVNHRQQKQHSHRNYHSISPNRSRPRPISTLPSINPSKQQNEQEYKVSNINEINRRPFLTESRKKLNQIVMPPTSD